MTPTNEEDRIRAILADVLDLRLDEVTEELTASKANAWDSLAHVRIVVSLEEEFGVDVPMDEVDELDEYLRIVEYIQGEDLKE